MLLFSSRREYQPSDTYDLLFAETRKDESATAFQDFINDTATIVTMGNSIKLYLSDTPQILGTPTYERKGLNITVKGISLSQDGFVLLVYGRAELFSAAPTVADLKDVSTYAGFLFEAFKKSQEIQLSLTENVEAKVEFGVYMVAFNNDPRKNAKTSPLISLKFNLTDEVKGSFGARASVSVWLAVLLLLFN